MSRNARTVVLFGVVGVALWFFPNLQRALGLPIFYLLFVYFLFFWIAQASSWNLFTGYSGYFSFGQGAFFGVGVYATADLAVKKGWPFLLAVPVGGLLAALLGVAIGLVVFRLRRLRGEIFALLTLAIAFVLSAVARVSSFVDGGTGVPLTGVRGPDFLGSFPEMMFRMGLVVAMATVLAALLIFRSRLGWGLFGIRDDEDVAEALGVPTFRHKMTALAISTFFAGLGGAVHALQISYVTIEDVFNIRVPLLVILMSVLGGFRHWMGPVTGAVVIYTLTDRLNRAGMDDLNQLIIGALLIIMVLAVKEGLYLRLRRRPWWTLAGFVVAAVAARLVMSEPSAVDLFAFGLAGVVVVALVPSRSGGAPSPDDAAAPIEEAVP